MRACGGSRTFTDPRLCAAIVDRLTFGGNIIETGTESYRLAITGPPKLRTPPQADQFDISGIVVTPLAIHGRFKGVGATSRRAHGDWRRER